MYFAGLASAQCPARRSSSRLLTLAAFAHAPVTRAADMPWLQKSGEPRCAHPQRAGVGTYHFNLDTVWSRLATGYIGFIACVAARRLQPRVYDREEGRRSIRRTEERV